MPKLLFTWFALLAPLIGACAVSDAAPNAGAALPPAQERPKPRVQTQLPLLAVVAGRGVGPIAIGANVATIQRLMQGPCEIRSENLCRYVSWGIDFHLVGGVTQWIHVQRAGRPAGRTLDRKNLEFGFFPGMIPPDLRLGMTPEAIIEYLGVPSRTERVPGPNPQNTVARHYYPGLVVEYDFWPKTQKHILGGIRVAGDPSIDWTVPVGADGRGSVDAGVPNDAGAPRAQAAAQRAIVRKEPEPR